ncbi:hypothetical protein [Halobacterium zhouii]|uniref:hypothetical protein n=1 Tax=Halobacterium zhouii TaxID=2902624 RepID=UPI001E2C9C63|nr:hypothetical protein [Halobacterium zhouii]
MFDRITRLGLFALYQSSLALGLLLLPVALVARQAGITLPFGRLVERTERAYRAAH